MSIVIKTVADMNTNEYRQAWGLNLGLNGFMQDELILQRRDRSERVFAYMLKQSDKILSWSLVMPPESTILYDGDEVNVHLFTRKSERRQGHASKLIRKIRSDFGEIAVHPHDLASGKFYGRFRKGIMIGSDGDIWIPRKWDRKNG